MDSATRLDVMRKLFGRMVWLSSRRRIDQVESRPKCFDFGYGVKGVGGVRQQRRLRPGPRGHGYSTRNCVRHPLRRQRVEASGQYRHGLSMQSEVCKARQVRSCIVCQNMFNVSSVEPRLFELKHHHDRCARSPSSEPFCHHCCGSLSCYVSTGVHNGQGIQITDYNANATPLRVLVHYFPSTSATLQGSPRPPPAH